jgi:hypothetical protein
MSAPCPTLGFVVAITPRSGVAEGESAPIDELARLLEANGLTMGLGAGPHEYVVSRDGSQATSLDRELVLEWGRHWARQASVTVSDIVDVNQYVGGGS